MLAALARRARQRLLLALTSERRRAARARRMRSRVLARTARSSARSRSTRAQTEELLSSVFGDVPNLGALAERASTSSRAATRASAWTSHSTSSIAARCATRAAAGRCREQLDPAELPRSAEDAMRAAHRHARPARALARAKRTRWRCSTAVDAHDYGACGRTRTAQSIARSCSCSATAALERRLAYYALARRSWARC